MHLIGDASRGGGIPDVADFRTPRLRLPRLRFRARVLGFLALLLLGATLAGLLVQRSVLQQRLESDITARLDQERAELEALASDGRDPATGQPFHGDVEAIFVTFLGRNVPEAGEAFITYIDGEPHRRTPFPRGVDEFPEMYEEWPDITEGRRGELDTEHGPLRYLAVTIGSEDGPRGVFVVVAFMEDERQRIDDDLRVQALVVGLVLLVALGIAWITAGRLLRPLRDVTETALTISHSDLSRRIPVDSDDEVGHLASTFNDMLDRLEAAFAAQQAFIADAGHELRTPITVIMGQLELMGDDPEERRETMAVVDDELRRMTRIVEDLLLLAKAEQPDFVRPELVELSDYTTELLMKSRTLADRTWRLDAAAEGTARFDPQRVTQAVLNLTRNAVEHTDADTEIGIGSAITEDGLVIWVRDDGPGIAAEDQKRLFDRFARGSRARRTPGGAGLGLAIVKAVANAHGGTIGVQSVEGEGSRFELTLPVECAGDTEAEAGTGGGTDVAVAPPPGDLATTEETGPEDPTADLALGDDPTLSQVTPSDDTPRRP